MRLYSYVLAHDSGFAPNPYAGYLTLATCKPQIRRTAKPGDWLLGAGSKQKFGENRVVYIAQVSESFKIEDYGSDPRFSEKIPTVGRELWRRRGDNIYFRNGDGEMQQRRNVHHQLDAMARDLRGVNALICWEFWYFGREPVAMPKTLLPLVKRGRGHSCFDSRGQINILVKWLSRFPKGMHALPMGEAEMKSSGKVSGGRGCGRAVGPENDRCEWQPTCDRL